MLKGRDKKGLSTMGFFRKEPTMVEKKGLSTIVATLLIILLTLVAVGIIWVVVRNVIQGGAEQISLGKLTLDLKLSQVQRINDSALTVTVKRNVGDGEFVGISFIIEDDSSSQVIKRNVSLQELETQSFQLYEITLVNISRATKISIAPIFRLESGKEVVGDVKDIYVFSYSSSVATCVPNCAGRNCGSDGCGGICGTCSGSTPNCVNYQCSAAACVPSCVGKTCGSDGCNGSCGTCSLANAASQCNSSYRCAISSCNANFANCDLNVSNGCETTLGTTSNCLACGNTCSTGYICSSTGCVSSCTDTCSSLGYNCGTQTVCGVSTNCGTCGTGYTCTGGTCVASCTNTCASLGYNCGTQTVCGVSTNCGTCSTGYACNSSGKCVCSSTCASLGYNCGTQTVCGVSTNCGTCSTGYACTGGTCVASTPVCGDGSCNGAETCTSCPGDCGTCSNVTYLRKFYVNATTGSDSNAGTSPASPWKTVSKVNSYTSFQPGDGILFERGKTWREQLIVPRSGNATNYITFGAYGSGN
ncbi:MAG: hypothetical protein WC915_06880, partial [archaeon]